MPDAERFAGTIVGPAGTVWTNDGTRTKWQLIVRFQGSCAVCIQNAHVLSNWWPIPFHKGCGCTQIPVRPGEQSRPFLDFRAEVERLDAVQQGVVMGTENYQLVRAGVVTWPDVVTKTSIRPFHVVVQRARLSESDLVALGIDQQAAREAIAIVQTSERLAAQARTRAAIDRLKELGLSDEEIKEAVTAKLASRFGTSKKPYKPHSP